MVTQDERNLWQRTVTSNAFQAALTRRRVLLRRRRFLVDQTVGKRCTNGSLKIKGRLRMRHYLQHSRESNPGLELDARFQSLSWDEFFKISRVELLLKF